MIRQATTKDFNFICDLYFNPQINPFLLYEMMDSRAFRPIFTALQKKNALFIFEKEGEKIGMFKLLPCTYRNTHVVYLGGVAIHPVHSGKGLGIEMLEDIVKLAKERGFLRVELTTATFNEKAIHIYEKVGFKQEGILRNFTFLQSENRYIDETVMAILLN